MASDALEQIAVGEGMMRLRVGEESTVLHCALFTGGAAIREISHLFRREWSIVGGDAETAMTTASMRCNCRAYTLICSPRRKLPLHSLALPVAEVRPPSMHWYGNVRP
jgi:hypothetical protein